VAGTIYLLILVVAFVSIGSGCSAANAKRASSRTPEFLSATARVVRMTMAHVDDSERGARSAIRRHQVLPTNQNITAAGAYERVLATCTFVVFVKPGRMDARAPKTCLVFENPNGNAKG
jgi:hypothetical protein